MSFNAKNLSYEANEPAFLRRLKSQYGGSNARQNPQQRPKKLKNNDDDDDAPTYVEEGSNEVISKEEYEALVRGDDPKDPEASEDKEGQPEATTQGPAKDSAAKRAGPKTRENIAGIGGPKKRKQAKVVGDEAAEGHGEEDEAQQRDSVANKPKQKKKKKKVKLSFDEPEGD
ncbi:hypothetical protein FQN54_006381 [Arachnomyces sp. PD_36]|nr:hypothetical protein FQN54_006381 [Arachnomyces sp. PD_36]